MSEFKKMTPKEMANLIPTYLPVRAFQITQKFIENCGEAFSALKSSHVIGMWIVIHEGQMHFPDKDFKELFVYAGDEIQMLHDVLDEPSKPEILKDIEVKMHFRLGRKGETLEAAKADYDERRAK